MHIRSLRGAAAAFLLGILGVFAITATAQPPGKGPPFGKGFGKGKDAAFASDRDLFHFLLSNRKDIKRTVKETKTGIETVTDEHTLVRFSSFRKVDVLFHDEKRATVDL